MNGIPVANLDDQRLIRDGEAAVDRYNNNIKNARADIMPMARGLVAAKRKYPATQEFGEWLKNSPYCEISPEDRAALINIGREEKFCAVLIGSTNLVSPRRIWEWVRDLKAQLSVEELLKQSAGFPSLYDTNSIEIVPQPAETDPEPSTTPISSVSASLEGQQKPESPSPPRYELTTSGGETMKNPANAELVKLLGLPVEQFVAVIGAYPYNRQRAFKTEMAKLAKNKNRRRAAGVLFSRAFAVVKAGQAPQLSNRDIVDARMFVPHVPEGLGRHIVGSDNNLSKLAQRIDWLDLLDSKAAEFAAAKTDAFVVHNELLHIWETGTVKPPVAARAVVLPSEDSKNRVKHDVKYCGELIWPNESLKHVTYQDLNMGWHIADHWLKYLETAKPLKPNELLVEIMHLVQDLRAASSLKGVTDVVVACVQAYAKRNQRKDKADLSDGFPPGKPR